MRKQSIDDAISSFYETLASEEDEASQPTPPDEFMESLVRGTAAKTVEIDKRIVTEIGELASGTHAGGRPQYSAPRRLRDDG